MIFLTLWLNKGGMKNCALKPRWPAGALQSSQVSLQNHRKADRQPRRVLQQRDVALPIAGEDASHAGPFWYGSSGPTTGGM